MKESQTQKEKKYKFATDLLFSALQKRTQDINKQLDHFVGPSDFLKIVPSNILFNNILDTVKIPLIEYAISLYLSQLEYKEAKDKSFYLYEIEYAMHNINPAILATGIKSLAKPVLARSIEKEILKRRKEEKLGNLEYYEIEPVLDIVHSDEFLTSCQKLIVFANFITTLCVQTDLLQTKKTDKRTLSLLQQFYYDEAKQSGIIDDLEKIISKCREWEQMEKTEKSVLQKERATISKKIEQIRQHSFKGLTEKEEQILGHYNTLLFYAYLAAQKEIQIDFLTEQINQLSYLEDEYKNEQLLLQYHIDTSQMTEEERQAILQTNNHSFQAWMEDFTRLQIDPSSLPINTLRQILQFGNRETIAELHASIIRDFISPSFIKNHPNLFVTEENEELTPMYETFIHNRNLLEKTRIDVHDETYQADILLTDPAIMKSKLSLVQLYQIDLSNTAEMMNYLSGKLSFDIMDTIIESNVSRKKIEMGKLKLSQQEFLQFQKRMAIAKQIGLFGNVSQGISTNTLLTGDKFKIPTSELDKFTANATFYFLDDNMVTILKKSNRDYFQQAEVIQLLTPYENGLTYQIGSTTLSAPKVKRNLQALKDAGYDNEEALFQSCLYGSILTLPQIEEIQQAIYPDKIKVKK